MDAQLATLFILTFAINLIGTLAYAARIAGVRTRRIALAFSLFNALVLISRTANSFQAPLLAKRVEGAILTGATASALADFRWLLFAASLATVVGALLTPTAQRLFSRGVTALTRRRSLPVRGRTHREPARGYCGRAVPARSRGGPRRSCRQDTVNSAPWPGDCALKRIVPGSRSDRGRRPEIMKPTRFYSACKSISRIRSIRERNDT